MSNKDWDPNLTPEQNYVLRQEGTESPGSSPLNNEKREGSYHCVGCGTKLFDSSTKYESGSGWPSFYKSLPEVFVEKKDVSQFVEIVQSLDLLLARIGFSVEHSALWVVL